ncbi:MAG: transglycosylase SLT domain-containing protein [Deltaproteobacteria bacterium]|nr:transglycosylase SLT domain-containing protein [Deltaproteobacteria bacterium]
MLVKVSSFPLIFNDKVGEFIDFFQTKADDFFSRALGRSQAYADMMKRILREKNLPEELFYLALIESGYNPKAFSRAKASGIWQFIAKTGKHYGLQINNWVDERRDPEKSTYAAARYLKDLYETFNCWDLATASYNAGEGKVMRAMKKTKSQDFWEISRSRHLKSETKKYVPMFRAAVLIAKEPQKYGFANVAYDPPLLYEKITVPPSTSLARIAKAAETDLSEIQDLNPALKRGKTPPNVRAFEVKIPPGKMEIFKKNFFAASSSRDNYHTVRRGETLSHIAKKYHLRIEELFTRNGLSAKSRLKPGMNIVLPQ